MKKEFSMTKVVLLLLTIGLLVFTYLGKISGEQFMAFVGLAYGNYFTRNNTIQTNQIEEGKKA